MEDLTFGEQVKIILSRKKMTIKQLAELIELQTGQKMSRQNLTQRLGRDNFQEQDMRMIAAILGCSFQLNIISGNEAPVELPIEIKKVRAAKPLSPEMHELKIDVEASEVASEVESEEAQLELEAKMEETAQDSEERDMTIGEVYDIHEKLEEQVEHLQEAETSKEEQKEPEVQVEVKPTVSTTSSGSKRVVKPDDPDFEPVIKHDDYEEDRVNGDVNPYTGREYQTNSVRVHPKRIGYVQVYDRSEHAWTDMTEWAFLGYQERKKVLLGKEYEPPIYLD